jgi:hypothetical protein
MIIIMNRRDKISGGKISGDKNTRMNTGDKSSETHNERKISGDKNSRMNARDKISAMHNGKKISGEKISGDNSIWITKYKWRTTLGGDKKKRSERRPPKNFRKRYLKEISPGHSVFSVRI